MTVKIGSHEFDWVSYDESGDVLYLSKGAPDEAGDTMASPEGHAVRLDRDGEVIGLTLVNARWLLEQEGEITVTVPERLTAQSDALTAAFTG